MLYHPIVTHPNINKHILTQTKSGAFQTPFFFGGSQVPSSINIGRYDGSKGEGFHKGSKSKTHLGDLDFTTKKGDLVYHRGGHYVKEVSKPYGKGFHKGSKSKTHLGDLDFTTKKGDIAFHREGHNIKIPHLLPFEK